MADDESLEEVTLHSKLVNTPPTVKLMFTLSAENALDSDDILGTSTHSH